MKYYTDFKTLIPKLSDEERDLLVTLQRLLKCREVNLNL
jgi:hypothetical protein